jgi:hypothetical protein
MKDSSEQSGAHAAHASQFAELNERLLRRLTEPVGVINVRYAQQKYERFAEWLDKRLALLHYLQSRYADNLADDSQPLVMQRQFGESINLYPTTVQSFSTVERSLSTAEQSVMPEVRDKSFARAEIAEPFSPSPTNQLSSEEIATAHMATRPVADSSSPAEREFRVSRRRAPFNPSPVQAASTPAQLPPSDRPLRAKQADAEPPGSASVAALGANENYEQDGSADSGRVNPRAAREIVQTAPSDTLSSSSLPLAKLQAAAEEVGQTAKTDVASGSSLPLAAQQALALPVERHERAGRRDARPTASQSTERREAVANGRESLMAAEITDGSFTQAKSEIVWRKSSRSSLDANLVSREQVGNPPSNARQVDGSSDAPPSQPIGQQRARANVHSQRGEMEIEQISPQVIHEISEKVMRAISLDLAIELERRGLKKWR